MNDDILVCRFCGDMTDNPENGCKCGRPDGVGDFVTLDEYGYHMEAETEAETETETEAETENWEDEREG